jgi:spore germination cell wall hydrolase CwlJ-like protein
MGMEIYCLAIALYHEARGEPLFGQQAVAQVIINRVVDERFPNTVCDVVTQKHKSSCQFSFYCDGKSDSPDDKKQWRRMVEVAKSAMIYYPQAEVIKDITHYHTTEVEPKWSKKLEKVIQIENHIFYR